MKLQVQRLQLGKMSKDPKESNETITSKTESKLEKLFDESEANLSISGWNMLHK